MGAKSNWLYCAGMVTIICLSIFIRNDRGLIWGNNRMNKDQADKIELLIRKSALKDVELWLQQQYLEIDKLLAEIEDKNV